MIHAKVTVVLCSSNGGIGLGSGLTKLRFGAYKAAREVMAQGCK